MKTVLKADMRPTAAAPDASGMGFRRDVAGFTSIDVYDLENRDLSDVAGIYLTGDVDQEFMLEITGKLAAFVERGGRLAVNGHVQRSFLPGLPRWRKLDFRGPDDLVLTRVTDHPVWEGTDPLAFLYSTGKQGKLEFSELEQIGVAGFYGRGCYLPLPDGARVIHTIGATRAPIDWEYQIGAGTVLVHGGNDLLGFSSADRGTEQLAGNLAAWLAQGTQTGLAGSQEMENAR